MQNPPQSFYVYLHIRATNGVVFYVGKGSGGRYKSKRNRNTHWKNIVAKHGLQIQIIADGLTEQEAFDLERATIEKIGRASLCNLTDGGEGGSGRIHSDEQRQNISRGTKKAFENPAIIEKLRQAQLGRKHSNETKSKQRDAKVGKPRSLETIQKIRAAKIGKKPSEEARRKMSESRKGRKHTQSAIEKMRQKALSRSPETIAKQIASNTGKTRSEEAKRNMSAAQKGKAVKCSNGMEFSKTSLAVKWLKENGHPKASIQSISKATRDAHRMAYGLKWALTEGYGQFAPTLR